MTHLDAELDVLLVGALGAEPVVARALEAAVQEHVAIVGVHLVQHNQVQVHRVVTVPVLRHQGVGPRV